MSASAKDRGGEYKFCAQCNLKFYRKPKLGDQDWFTRKFCSQQCSRDSQKKMFQFKRPGGR